MIASHTPSLKLQDDVHPIKKAQNQFTIACNTGEIMCKMLYIATITFLPIS